MYSYNQGGGIGISLGLGPVMFIEQGTALNQGGGLSANDAFAGVQVSAAAPAPTAAPPMGGPAAAPLQGGMTPPQTAAPQQAAPTATPPQANMAPPTAAPAAGAPMPPVGGPPVA